MIRANDSGLANAPAVVEDEPPAKKGLLTPRNVIILVGVVAWIAVVVLFVLPRFTAKPAPPASAPAAAAAAVPVAPAAEAKPAAISEEAAGGGVTPPPPAVPAPVLSITNRVFNLAGTGAGFKYLKLSIDVRFEDEGKFAKAKGEALKKLEDDFAAENAGTLGAFNDILTTTVSSRTAADLSTGKGKEALRTQLIAQFNRALAAGGSKERVTYVSFNDFVMQ